MSTSAIDHDYLPLHDGRPDEEDADSEEARGQGGFPQLRIVVQGGQSSLASVFTLCNSCIGAGVLALPYALRCAGTPSNRLSKPILNINTATGLLGGALLCVVAGVIMGFTLFVLVRFTEYYRAHSYQGLVRRALGKKTAMCTAAILGLYLFGGCIAYLVIIGSSCTSFRLGVGGSCLVLRSLGGTCTYVCVLLLRTTTDHAQRSCTQVTRLPTLHCTTSAKGAYA